MYNGIHQHSKVLNIILPQLVKYLFVVAFTVFSKLKAVKQEWKAQSHRLCNEWKIYDRFCDNFISAWQLPDNWLTTAWRLPDDCLMTAWWLPDNCLTTAWRLPDNCLTSAWHLLDNCLTIAWQLPDDCLTTAWRLLDDCLTTARRLPDNHSVCIL